MLYSSILNYQKSRYLKIALLISVVALLAYIVDQPIQSPNGGTWLGYTLGTISTFLVLWLTYLGIRKRSYKSSGGKLRGWVSAHVYLGGSLLVMATLHTGFQFGWNIHIASYIFMCIVIITGFVGIYFYLNYPDRINRARNNLPRDEIIMELLAIDQRCLQIAVKANADVSLAISSAITQTKLPTNFIGGLKAKDLSTVTLINSQKQENTIENSEQKQVINYLIEKLAYEPNRSDSQIIQNLIDTFNQRRKLITTLINDKKLQMTMKAWLVIHIPMTFALLSTLTAHIISVFIYW